MPAQPSARKLASHASEVYYQYRDCDRWAVIVGISQYQHQHLNLKYADRDAEKLYQLLLTPCGGSFQRDHIYKLVNEQATTANITRALRSFLKKPAREDLVLIYLACHGSPDPDRPSNIYLLTHDADPNDIAGTALPMEDIDRALRDILHSEKVIVLADTCHSAAIGGSIGGRRSVTDEARLINRFLQEISRAKGGVALLTSAEANEVSFEDAKWGGGHGVFTHYLLEGMRGAADRDDNNIVTVGELFEYVRDQVKQATGYRQHPSIGTNAFDRNLPIALVTTNSQIAERSAVATSEQGKTSENSPIFTFSAAQLAQISSLEKRSFEFKVVSVNESGQQIDCRYQTTESFIQNLDNKSILEMVAVPGGSFLMGTSTNSKRLSKEKPQHQVTVKPFLMSKYTITNAQWRAVTSLSQVKRKLQTRPSRQWAARQPVVGVSWHDAIEFCDRLSKKLGYTYRLPTEAEWEYACRAGTETPFHFGETLTADLASYDATLPYKAAPKGNKREKAAPVGNFQVANSFGLFDMHGNVWEWCLDHWHESYDGAPTAGEAWLDNHENFNRVLRGGSWQNEPLRCRSACRWYGSIDEKANNIGFRIIQQL
jgi:formylglycine-generating enzyme required for sulfatase activity/uncharacterized caspase-like protein